MPMTKKMRHELLAVLSAMERAQTFIADSSVAVCRIDNVALHFALTPAILVSAQTRLSDAIRNLKRVLES